MDFEKTRTSLDKAVEKLEKKRALLVKYENKAEKQRKEIEKKGWNPEDAHGLPSAHPEYHDSYWAVCNYRTTLESIKSTKRAIKEQEGVVQRWEEKCAKAKAENKEHDELPEVLVIVQNNICEEWNRYDLERKSRLKAEYAEIGYKNFKKKHEGSDYRFMMKTEEEIRKDNARTSRALVLNLWKRVKEITGKVTDTSELRIRSANSFEGIALNGYVVGENGTAEVESILAGGYNIQKLHIRTLVHRR